MKYLRVFNNDSEYQTFIGGLDYITPNICLIKETGQIKLEPATIDGLTFPVYLDNNDLELGAEVYNYLYNKYNVKYINIDEEIYVYREENNKWCRLKYLNWDYGDRLEFTMVNYNTTYCQIYPNGKYYILNSSGSD